MATKQIKVALLGNPNSGKTSLFNALAGTNQKVGNFSGVTIEKYEGVLKYESYEIKLIDLPGTYSLTAYSPEEVIARNYIIEDKPDVVIDVVDGSSLERNLYLTTQLMELETEMIVALNMFDEVEKAGTKIDIKQLQKLFGSHIITTSAVKKTGISSLLDHVVRVYEKKIDIKKNKLTLRLEIEDKLLDICELLKGVKGLKKYNHRWLAIKLMENDKEVYNLVKEYPVWIQLEEILKKSIIDCKNKYQSDPEVLITEDRHAFIHGAIKETVEFPSTKKKTLTEKIDSIIINRVLGFPIFMGIMWLVFQFTFKLGEAPMGWIDLFFEFLSGVATSVLPEGMVQSIIVDGIIAGVGGVLVFLPNILLLFIALAFLEGTGYMARAAFVIDKIMHKIGLHGKSFIPMITGFGCSIPAIMATRTLKNRGDRLTTIMIIPFMSCGAKLPVYVLLISAFFSTGAAGNVLFGIYVLGIIVALLSAKILKKTLFIGESEPFVMELPPYRMPTIKTTLIQAKIKAFMYLKKAGTIILAASILIWAASNFPQNKVLEARYEEQINQVNINRSLTQEKKDELLSNIEFENQYMQLEYSIAGRLGKSIEPFIKPLGFDWKIGVALGTGLAAKEVVVSTLGTIYSLGEVDEESVDLAEKLRADPDFTLATALSLMIFVLLYMPCIAAIGVFKKEAGAWKWIVIYAIYSTSAAWILSFTAYRVTLFITG
ncbi:MAG: ferrous iron transport protein B [bacterium]|nr:ferrous iron transport protein B [bacterium]